MNLRCFPQSGTRLGRWKARRLARDAEHPAIRRVLYEGEAIAIARPTLIDSDQMTFPVVFLMLPSPRGQPPSDSKWQSGSPQGVVRGYAEAPLKIESFLAQHRFLLHLAATFLAVADSSAGRHLNDMGGASGNGQLAQESVSRVNRRK
jgi:hypothetical protein